VNTEAADDAAPVESIQTGWQRITGMPPIRKHGGGSSDGAARNRRRKIIDRLARQAGGTDNPLRLGEIALCVA